MKPTLRLSNRRTGDLIADQVAVADNPWTRMKGLLGKQDMQQGHALLIRPCSSVHTFFMRFNLDVMFLDRQHRVLKVVKDLKAFRLAGARGSHIVVEFTGGALADLEILPGDQMDLAEITAE
jgi:uncharacterized membrane protein (UPF0127 family)